MEQHPISPGATCPECGAPQVAGLTCWEQLGLLIAWEYQDPDLQAEHFLTVASYNLQHPAQFTAEVQADLRAVFIEWLDIGMTVNDVRRRFAQAYAGKMRVLKAPAERHPVLRSWSMTIADVYTPDTPEDAASRVRAWASSIRNEL